MHKLFEIVELLDQIIESLPHPVQPRHLVNYALVAKNWSPTSLRLLWRCPYKKEPWIHWDDVCKTLVDLVSGEVEKTDKGVGFAKALQYASYIRKMAINYEEVRDMEHLTPIFLLMTKGTIFSSLEVLELIHDEEDSGPVASITPFQAMQRTQLFMQAAPLKLQAIRINLPEDSYWDSHFNLAFGGIREHCTSLEKLEILHHWNDVPISPSRTTHDALHCVANLKLAYIPITVDLIRILASLRTLEHLDIDGQEDIYPRPRFNDSDISDVRGFKGIKSLKIDGTTYLVHTILSTLPEDNCLEMLHASLHVDDVPAESPLIPEEFVAIHLTDLKVRGSILADPRVLDNVKSSLQELRKLESIDIDSPEYCGDGTDREWVDAIKHCAQLKTLALFYSSEHCTVRSCISLAFLEAILLHCPLITSIKGSFDIEQTKTGMIPASQRHQNLEFVDLARSYFRTVDDSDDEEEEDSDSDSDDSDSETSSVDSDDRKFDRLLAWVPVAVGYLASLTTKEITVKMHKEEWCTLEENDSPSYSEQERRGVAVQVMGQCVKAVNFLKRSQPQVAR